MKFSYCSLCFLTFFSSLVLFPIHIANADPINKSDIPVNVKNNNVSKITGYPLPNNTGISLGYGWNYHPVTKEAVFHGGVDLLAPVGTPVTAIAPGIVVFAKEQGSYGKLVIINHADGLQSRYAQLEGIKVTLGQKVNQGHILGTVGTTGQPTSIQPHLHFEIRVRGFLGWEAKDPQGFSI